MSDRCFICGEDNPHVLEEHHIIPRRHGGADDPENLVTLCANCHTAVEKLYDDDVFRQLGAAPLRSVPEQRADKETVRNAVGRFLRECEHVSTGADGWATKRAVRELYADWADRNGVDVSPTPRQFGVALADLREDVDTTQRRVDGSAVRVYTGLVLEQLAADGG
jgi:hypothetical protein